MQYFLLTDAGETGPYTPAALNRMFQKGQIRGEQLCREENSQQTRRLDEVFHHFAPSQEVVKAARKNVAGWNQRDGAASFSTGLGLLVCGVLVAVIKGSIATGIACFIVGVGLIINGRAQERRGNEAAAKLAESEPKAPTPSSQPAEQSGPPRTYDY